MGGSLEIQLILVLPEWVIWDVRVMVEGLVWEIRTGHHVALYPSALSWAPTLWLAAAIPGLLNLAGG